MGQVKNGDLSKLAGLFDRHHRPLFHYFLRMCGSREMAEDLAQEVFFRILRYRQSYDPKHPFTAWMYQIARNAYMDQLQKKKTESLPDADIASNERGAEDNLSKQQQVALLRRALAKLPDDKREVLVLSRFQSLKYEQIAEILGIETGAVKVRVYRAVRALSEIYNELAGART